MSSDKPRILMAVFNPLEFDGRVQRSAEALCEAADVEVLAIDGGRGFTPAAPYRLAVLPVAPGEFGGNRLLHLRFLREFVRRARRQRPDLVYAHDFFLALSGWLAARLSGALFVYDAHELIIPGSLGRSRGRMQERFWYWLERLILRRADLVIAANVERAGLMREHYKLAREPLPVRNITVPPTDPAPDANVLREKYPFVTRRSADECLVVYQGDVNLDRGLAPLIDAFPLLGPNYRLLVVGGGPDVETVRARAVDQPGETRIDVVGKVARSALTEILRACDIGVVMYSFSGLNNIYCSPNKVFEYAQAGLAVVGTGQPPLVRLVAESGIGRIAGNGVAPTPQDVAQAIREVHGRIAAHRAVLADFLASNRWQDEMQRLRSAVMALLAARA